jgi:hypothetical protein
MIAAYPGQRAVSGQLQLPFEIEETVTLVPKTVFMDLLSNEGSWYASLRIMERETQVGKASPDGPNGYCDCWHGPHHTRDAALSNGYLFGRDNAKAHGVASALSLAPRVWEYLERSAA